MSDFNPCISYYPTVPARVSEQLSSGGVYRVKLSNHFRKNNRPMANVLTDVSYPVERRERKLDDEF